MTKTKTTQKTNTSVDPGLSDCVEKKSAERIQQDSRMRRQEKPKAMREERERVRTYT
jgi:hypothetical protein